jgi:hypothetical protein
MLMHDDQRLYDEGPNYRLLSSHRNVQTKSPTLNHGMSSPQFGDNINASLKV